MEFCWATINVSEMEQSICFYRDFLDLEVNRRFSPSPEMEITFLGKGETKVELVKAARAPAVQCGKGLSLGFVVSSIENVLQRLEEHDIPVESGPFQPNPHIRFLYVRDPDGVRIQLVENVG